MTVILDEGKEQNVATSRFFSGDNDYITTAITLEQLLEETPIAYFWAGYALPHVIVQQHSITLYCVLTRSAYFHQFARFVGAEQFVQRSAHGYQFEVSLEHVAARAFLCKFNSVNNNTKRLPDFDPSSIKSDKLFFAFALGLLLSGRAITPYRSSIKIVLNGRPRDEEMLNALRERLMRILHTTLPNVFNATNSAGSKFIRLVLTSREQLRLIKHIGLDLGLPVDTNGWEHLQAFDRSFDISDERDVEQSVSPTILRLAESVIDDDETEFTEDELRLPDEEEFDDGVEEDDCADVKDDNDEQQSVAIVQPTGSITIRELLSSLADSNLDVAYIIVCK